MVQPSPFTGHLLSRCMRSMGREGHVTAAVSHVRPQVFQAGGAHKALLTSQHDASHQVVPFKLCVKYPVGSSLDLYWNIGILDLWNICR